MRRWALCAVLAGLCSILVAPAWAASPPTWTSALVDQPADAASLHQQPVGISCGTDDSCAVIGAYDSDSVYQGAFLAMQHDGSTVSSVAAPLPAAGAGATPTLTSVSCWTASRCVAVGSYTGQASGGLIETLQPDGTWRPTGVAGVPKEVGCNITMCVATLTRSSRVLARRAGQGWRAEQVTAATDYGVLQPDHVSCPPGGNCVLTVLDQNQTTFADRALFAYPSGDGWRAVFFPMPDGADATTLKVTRMTCPAFERCLAFGTVKIRGHYLFKLLVERWSYGRLAVTQLPIPADVRAGYDWYDEQVACGSLTHCAGYAVGGGAYNALLYRWDGARWHVATRPTTVYPTEVACSHTGPCVVRGYTNFAPWPLVVTLAGSTWSTTRLPFPTTQPAATVGDSAGVSCAATTCSAVANASDRIVGHDRAFVAKGTQ